jgi:hypothetical protein
MSRLGPGNYLCNIFPSKLIEINTVQNVKGLSYPDGRIFLKTRRDVSFNKVLSNEPNFGRIHLAGLTVPLSEINNLDLRIKKRSYI